jgi:hypothetical protein
MPTPNPAAPPDVGDGARVPFFFRPCARARAPPEEIRRWGVELTTDGEWSWRGEGPCAARGDPPVRLAAAQYVREAN